MRQMLLSRHMNKVLVVTETALRQVFRGYQAHGTSAGRILTPTTKKN
jgi:hypothetical protein